MLPEPASSYHRLRKPSHASLGANDAWRNRLHLLSARSRVTNLAVLLLSTSLALSLFLNLWHWLRDVRDSYDRRWEGRDAVRSIEEAIERPLGLTELEHLIVVPGHGVWMGNEPEETYDEGTWALEHYQSGDGAMSRISAFIGHIRRGVELANNDPSSLLVFSGGSTRQQTAESESVSYFSLALALALIHPSSSPSAGAPLNTYQRTTTEDYALDSFQNLLFSVARFRTVTGHYPKRITVVGYAMKGTRFTELHRAALRWPGTHWRYIGIDIEDPVTREEAMKGERANGYLPYADDPYGCHGTLLAKRRRRNVHRQAHPYHVSAPEIAPLLEWCPDVASRLRFAPDVDNGRRVGTGQELVGLFEGPLPWDGL